MRFARRGENPFFGFLRSPFRRWGEVLWDTSQETALVVAIPIFPLSGLEVSPLNFRFTPRTSAKRADLVAPIPHDMFMIRVGRRCVTAHTPVQYLFSPTR